MRRGTHLHAIMEDIFLWFSRCPSTAEVEQSFEQIQSCIPAAINAEDKKTLHSCAGQLGILADTYPWLRGAEPAIEERIEVAVEKDGQRGATLSGKPDLVLRNPEVNGIAVVDYKFGKVKAAGAAEQEKLYAYLAVGGDDFVSGAATIICATIQPAVSPTPIISVMRSKSEAPIRELYERMAFVATLEEEALLAAGDNPPYRVSPAACQWCAAKKAGTCEAYKKSPLAARDRKREATIKAKEKGD